MPPRFNGATPTGHSGDLREAAQMMQRIDIPTLAEFKALASARGAPCVSLYMPTSPLHDHVEANRIFFKDLSHEAISQLNEAGVEKCRIAALEERFGHLAGTHLPNPDDNKFRYRGRPPSAEVEEFWRSQANGLAVLATPETLRTFRLPDGPRPLAEVADRFHLTPLIRAMTSPHEIFVLALSENHVRLIHVFRNLPPVPVQVPDLPKDASEATRRPSVNARSPHGRLHGLEGKKVLLQQYARKVNEAVRGAIGEQTRHLVLAATEPLASLFKSESTIPQLVDEMIVGNPDHMSDAQLADAALPILDHLYARELSAILARYEELKPRRATTDISYAAHAATADAIDQLLVDLDVVVPGLVSGVDGSVTYSTSDDAETYSVVDEVARRALCAGARVLGAKREQLPNGGPLVATLRYQFGVIAAPGV